MIVLDASFIVKLVLEEEGSETAATLLKEWILGGETIKTVDIALPETLNALWKHHIIIRDLGQDSLREAVRDLLMLWDKLSYTHSSELADDALDIAVKHGITIYDALYLALAQRHSASLATFDKKLKTTANKLGIKTHPTPGQR